MAFLLFYAAALLLVIALIALASYGIYRFAKAYLPHPAWTFLAWLPPLAVAITVFFALYPTGSFYVADYYEVTGMELPPDAEFVLTSATYPDQHGDYTSVAVIKMEGRYYEALRARVMERGWQTGSPIHHSDLSAEAQAALADTTWRHNLEAPFDGEDEYKQTEHYFVGFGKDGQTVVVERSSW